MPEEDPNHKEYKPYNTRLHSKDFVLRFEESKDALSEQNVKKLKQSIKKKKKKKENKSKKKSKAGDKRGQRHNHAQCSECGEWYSEKIITIHESQCRLLREGLETDINNEGDSTLNEPLHLSRKNRINVKCPNQGSDQVFSKSKETSPPQNSNVPAEDNYRFYENAWMAFEETAFSRGRVGVSEIPFPPAQSNELSNLGLPPEVSIQEKKVRIREMLIRWHPDHFMQKFKSVLRLEDISEIESRLNEVVRLISALKATYSNTTGIS